MQMITENQNPAKINDRKEEQWRKSNTCRLHHIY